ncbi:MAG: TetM/TetW/TetO/TetS family tetracycline resistance ribosomal protection protein [Clostridia bacterium]|nr:TetM/TetW/TetO/TetS family tetracycline resistance ribosomal protection protein [Clostridia bacterium]
MKKLVLGILSHVDSGKTTLSEALLYKSGTIRKLGRVDNGSAFLDSYSLERDRGITIFSKQAILNFEDTYITLLDTPGHVDFSSEMERTLQVLDYAILVISGTDGVQSHTETLWKLLQRYSVPTFIFVNKMDMDGADKPFIMRALRGRFGDNCVDFSKYVDEDERNEALSLCDEQILNEYLETGEISEETLAAAIVRRNLFPCFFGSALKLEGIDEFVEKFVSLTRMPHYDEYFGAKVFKIQDDGQGNRLSYMKITGGTLNVRDLVKAKNQKGESWEEKISRIRIYNGTKFEAVDSVDAGTVCAVTGLTQTYPGEGLGIETESDLPTLEPVLTYKVNYPKEIDAHTALVRFRKLEEEDPQLHIVWNEQLQELNVQLMGEVQLEVLQHLVKERFNMDVTFGTGSIVYKETIAEPVHGAGHFEPLRHYAEVHLLIEPAKRGSGLSFATSCRVDDLDLNWQRLVLTHLEEKTHVGVLTGSPLTDVRITLIAGRAHLKHTEGGDFRQATYRAVRHALMNAENILLEPYYAYKLEVPTENIGRAMTDIQKMKGNFDTPLTEGDMTIITGSCPVSTMLDYHRELNSYSRGRGRLSINLKGYEPCHNAEEVIAELGYDADADLDNTADSVFCSHGAGYVVPWREAESHMHIEIEGLPKSSEDIDESEAEEIIEEPTYVPRVPTSSIEQDKELLAIFERTYGPIKRDPRVDFRPVREHTYKETVYRQKNNPTGPEYLLVDGYNIIFGWESLKELSKDNLESARMKLIDIMSNYQGFRKNKVIVVFDAYKVKGTHREVETWHNISVVYTKEAETADMYIEKVTKDLAKKHRVRVATSDALEQIIILGHGATRISARAFEEEVKETEQEIRDYLLSKQGLNSGSANIIIKES